MAIVCEKAAEKYPFRTLSPLFSFFPCFESGGEQLGGEMGARNMDICVRYDDIMPLISENKARKQD